MMNICITKPMIDHTLYILRPSTKLKASSPKLHEISICCFGCVFRKCGLPAGLTKELPKIKQIPKCLDLIDCTVVLTICTCKFDATTTPQMHLNTPPACFEGPRGQKIRFRDPGGWKNAKLALSFVEGYIICCIHDMLHR